MTADLNCSASKPQVLAINSLPIGGNHVLHGIACGDILNGAHGTFFVLRTPWEKVDRMIGEI